MNIYVKYAKIFEIYFDYKFFSFYFANSYF